MSVKLIAAVSKDGVIGQNGKLPFDHPADMKFFRKMTAGATVIMGRKTFESIGRVLPKRRNIVISSKKMEVPDLETFSSLEAAIHSAQSVKLVEGEPTPPDAWLIGGANIYREGMRYANEIFLTLTPDIIEGEGLIFFPWIDPSKFQVSEYIALENSPLKVAHYVAS